jgi:hypothetical protein
MFMIVLTGTKTTKRVQVRIRYSPVNPNEIRIAIFNSVKEETGICDPREAQAAAGVGKLFVPAGTFEAVFPSYHCESG